MRHYVPAHRELDAARQAPARGWDGPGRSPDGYRYYPGGSTVPHHYQDKALPPPPPHHQQYQQAAPAPAPVHTTTIHTKTQASPHFHPYQPKPRPLLFVNTIAPPASSSGGPIAPDMLNQLKPKRKRITPEQFSALTSLFDQTESPSFDVREQLGLKLGMTNREVQVWFQNRRAKMNRLKAQGAATTSASEEEQKDPSPGPAQTTSARSSRTPSPTSLPSSVPRAMGDQISSFRLPVSSPAPLPPLPSPSSPSSPHLNPLSPSLASPHMRPSEAGRARQRPFSHFIEIPDRHTLDYRRSPPGRASSLPLPSPYLGMRSPVSPSFPGASPSPAFSSASSGYFSSTADVTSPYTNASSISSPTSTFFRLSLESPALPSPRSDASGSFSPGLSADLSGAQTPSTPSEASFIRLPPIRKPSEADDPAGPSRTPSDGPSRLNKDGLRLQLPSFQSLVDSVESGTKEGYLSAPTSPIDARPPPPPSPIDSSRLSASHATRAFHLQRRSKHRPSSLSHLLPSTAEEPLGTKSSSPPYEQPVEPLGLGMLAVAAEESLATEKAEQERLESYSRTRRMSYDVNGQLATPHSV
ncbi:homeobox protein YOX1/YHP1 [Pseudohyphozyma bogoriensis]|nr:homeobox protein YOX1/YHP1 [Pseudohyphozyma bogoriensis]